MSATVMYFVFESLLRASMKSTSEAFEHSSSKHGTRVEMSVSEWTNLNCGPDSSANQRCCACERLWAK